MQNPKSQSNNFEYVLGSASPRRFELLKDILPNLSQEAIHADESFSSQMDIREVAAYLAQRKADAYSWKHENQILITADTTVLLENQILNKPESEDEAFSMLSALSGKSHEVCSAFCIQHKDQRIVRSDYTQVVFKTLEKEEIDHYIDLYKPFDKAGSYGIQEWIGRIGIREIHGSYYTVMGLPTDLVYHQLKKEKWI